jgi:hypothetical protein
MELLTLFAALQVADGISTFVFLRKGVLEANPVLAYLFQRIDPLAALIGIKSAAVWAAYATMGVPYWKECVLTFCVVYTVVVVNNIRLILNHR